jgi:hypothetical protein
MSYYDIDDILCEEQEIEVQLAVEVANAHTFDPQYTEEQEVKELHVPFWLGRVMMQFESNGQRGSVNNPEIYMDERLNILFSNPIMKLRVEHYAYSRTSPNTTLNSPSRCSLS